MLNQPSFPNIAAIRHVMSRDAKLRGPAVAVAHDRAPQPAHDACPAANTRSVFATLGLELGLRAESTLG